MADLSPIIIARFWSKVDVAISDGQCWPWRAHVAADGYGKFRADGVTFQAHRIAWQVANGRDPGPLVIRHKCDNRQCCNPQHLEVGTQVENMADMVARGRSARGEANSHAVLTEADVMAIRARIAAGEMNTEIARDYPITHSMVSRIRRGKAWVSVPRGFATPALAG